MKFWPGIRRNGLVENMRVTANLVHLAPFIWPRSSGLAHLALLL